MFFLRSSIAARERAGSGSSVRGAMAGLRQSSAVAPSINQTRIGNVTNSAGQILRGASPSVDAAPARNAISARV